MGTDESDDEEEDEEAALMRALEMSVAAEEEEESAAAVDAGDVDLTLADDLGNTFTSSRLFSLQLSHSHFISLTFTSTL